MKSVIVPALFALIPVLGLAQNAPMNEQPVPMPAPPMSAQAPMPAPPMPGQPAMQAPMPGQAPIMGEPGYYGQIDPAGNNPPLVYSTPVVVQPTQVYYPPVYLRVPPVYYQNWPQYCGYYNACFYPVFFVQEGWYLNWYSPWYHRYYPYGRPGFSVHLYYNPRYGGGYRPGPHYDHYGHHEGHEGHDDHHR
jgi:hypothetical protein